MKPSRSTRRSTLPGKEIDLDRGDELTSKRVELWNIVHENPDWACNRLDDSIVMLETTMRELLPHSLRLYKHRGHQDYIKAIFQSLRHVVNDTAGITHGRVAPHTLL